MKQLILLAAAVLLFASCKKQPTCTCSTAGQPGFEVVGISSEECNAYETRVADRDCVYDDKF